MSRRRLTAPQLAYRDKLRRARVHDQAMNPRPPSVFEQFCGHDCHRCHRALSDIEQTIIKEGDGLFFAHRGPCPA